MEKNTHFFKETVEVDVHNVARVGVEQNVFAVSVTQSVNPLATTIGARRLDG